LVDAERAAQRGRGLGEHAEQVRNEAETASDALEQRAARSRRGVGRMNGELSHGESPWLVRDEPCPPRGEGIDCRTMAGRVSTETPNSISETPGTDLLSDVLQTLRLRGRIFKQGSYCGDWALDATGATGTIFHLIGRGQAWVHREGERDPLIVRGGDLVMFPHADWHQISGTPQRQPGMRPGGTGEGQFTTVLCARVDFEAGGANPILQVLPKVIVVRSEDRGTSAELHALARLMLVEY